MESMKTETCHIAEHYREREVDAIGILLYCVYVKIQQKLKSGN